MSTIQTINLSFVNCYLLKNEDRYILVDTGVPGMYTTLEKSLQDAGCIPGKLGLIILTHGDIDHAGNAAYLKTKYNTKVAIRKEDAPMVEKKELLMQRKVKSVVMRMMQSIMNFLGSYKKMTAAFQSFTPDLYLEDGQELKTYGFDAKILHLPGHTPGSIAVLFENGDIIAGDTLQNMRKPNTAQIIDNETVFAESIERLKQLSLKTVYPGHGKPFPWQSFLKK